MDILYLNCYRVVVGYTNPRLGPIGCSVIFNHCRRAVLGFLDLFCRCVIPNRDHLGGCCKPQSPLRCRRFFKPQTGISELQDGFSERVHPWQGLNQKQEGAWLRPVNPNTRFEGQLLTLDRGYLDGRWGVVGGLVLDSICDT